MIKKAFISTLLASSLFAGFEDMGQLTSTTHQKSVVSNKSSITMSWNQAVSDDFEQLQGYYYILDNTEDTLIPNVADSRENIGSSATSVTKDISNDGDNYYFHLAPYSQTQIGATLHFGPILIDTTTPVLSVSPDGGTFDDGTSVSLSAVDSSDYTIYYTTNGDTPTKYSSQYSSAIAISQDTVLKAIAIDSAGNESEVSSSSFTINVASTDVVFGSEISNGDKIVLSGDNSVSSLSVTSQGASGYDYKIDDGSWLGDDNKISISTPISLSSLSLGSHTIYIRTDSNATEKSISFEVVDQVVVLPDDVSVDISNTDISKNTTVNFTSDDTVYFTVDGSTPTEQSVSASSYNITSSDNGTLTLKAVAYKNSIRSASILTKVFNVSIAASTTTTTNTGSTSSTTTTTSSTGSTTTTTIQAEEEITKEPVTVSGKLVTNVIADIGISLSKVEESIITNKIQYEMDNGTNSALSTALTIMGLSSDAKEKAKNSGDINSYVQELIGKVNSKMKELEE
jgi:hypothetical protein